MNSLNNLIQSHDMYDDFDTSFTDSTPSNLPKQPPFAPAPQVVQNTTNYESQATPTIEPSFTQEIPQPSYTERFQQSQYVTPFQTPQPAPAMDQAALHSMIMEIQDIERRLHVLFHSCQRLLQYNQPPAMPRQQQLPPQQPHFQHTATMPQQPNYYAKPVPPPIMEEPAAVPAQPLGIKEGVFDGEHMISADGETYKVPPTFACKAKLIEGDFMKAQVFSSGQVKFKQAEASERENIMGILSTHSANSPYYIVQTASKAYKVLLEAVQMHNGTPGAQVLLIVPQGGESEWAAIETIYKAA